MAEINANLEAVPVQERRRGHIAMLFANMVWGLMSPVSKEVLMHHTAGVVGYQSVGRRIALLAVFVPTATKRSGA